MGLLDRVNLSPAYGRPASGPSFDTSLGTVPASRTSIPVDLDFEPSPVYDLPPHVTSFLDRAAKGTNMNNRIGQYTDMALSGMSVKDIADQDEQDQLQRKAVDIARQTMDLSDEEFENAMRQYEQAALSVPNAPQYGNAEPDMFDQLGSVLGMALDRGHATAYPRLAKAAAKERADEKYRREMEGYKGQMQGYEARVAAGKFEADRAGRRRDRSETDYLRELGKQDAREAAKQMKADESDRMMAALKLRLEETARQKELDRDLKRQSWGFQYQKQFVLDRAKYIQESTMPQPEKQAALAKLAREYDPDVFEEPEVKAVLGSQTYQQANMASRTKGQDLKNEYQKIANEFAARGFQKKLDVQDAQIRNLNSLVKYRPAMMQMAFARFGLGVMVAQQNAGNQGFDNAFAAWKARVQPEMDGHATRSDALEKRRTELEAQLGGVTDADKRNGIQSQIGDIAKEQKRIRDRVNAITDTMPTPAPQQDFTVQPGVGGNVPMKVQFPSSPNDVPIPPAVKAEADRRAGRNTKQKPKPQPRQQAKTPPKGSTTFQGRVDGANVKVTVRKKQ